MTFTLPLAPPDATPIAACFSMATDQGITTYFSNLQPIECHPAHDSRARMRQLAKLHVTCGVRKCDLMRAFEVSQSTVKKVVKLYLEQGDAGFFKPRRGRGRTVINEEMAHRAAQRLACGMSGRAVAKALGIAVSTFNENLRAGVISAPAKVPDSANIDNTKAQPATDRAARDTRDKQAPMGRAARDVEGRLLASTGLMEAAQPTFSEPATAVARGGVLAALPMLMKEGLLDTALRLFRLPNGYYGLTSILLFLAFMTLARVRNPESLRYQAPGEWGLLLGLDRCPEVKTLRRKIRLLAKAEQTVRDWQAALARRWTDEDPDDWATLALDGHVKVYAGRKGRLPKHFVTRQKLCLPATAAYWVNALGGKPLLCLHKALDPKRVKALEHDGVPELESLGLLAQDAPDLTQPGAGGPALTLVFDREGWSPDLFRRLARRGIACITWHKNFKGRDWPAQDFREVRVPIRGPAETRQSPVVLAEQEITLRNNLKVRQIRRLLETGRQVALITTDPHKPMEEVAGAMVSRWSQENYFKSMRDEFNLDALPTHDLEPVDPNAKVVNPARRTLEKTITRIRSRLAAVRNRIAEMAKTANTKRTAELQARADTLDQEIGTLKQEREQRPNHVAARDLPDDQKLHALPIAERLLLDIIRMIAYRAETRMMPAVSEAQGKKRNARKLLRTLLTSDANIIPETEQGTLTVQLLGLGNTACERALEPLITELNATETIYPGTELRLVYEMSGKCP